MTSWHRNIFYFFALIFNLIHLIKSQQFQQQGQGMHAPIQQHQPDFAYQQIQQPVQGEAHRPWYESLPAVAMDYKVHIDAGKEDCYFQYVQPGATFYVAFSVVRGGDGMAGFAVRNPAGQIVKPYQWQPSADYTDQTSPGGYYSVCIDNQFSRFAGKLINIYITVVKYDAWDKYAKEIEELQLNMQNFTQVIGTVERNINDMLTYQSHSKSREARDYALLIDNNSYVQKFSLAQIFIILITCSVQVLFVRKLFDVKTGSSGSRSRI
ncbi:transmembrane emp24 domain-containing protein B [Condylostylus longicornis]|uniref:transmembrane emp24 domain-containing protein B n=1 Tax=Condylostylus longicornis TaxID=2530218 RepID=UPI00244DBA60|nr:transmembrane emp24 domain-containing protein B [Condylostylus longicornis]